MKSKVLVTTLAIALAFVTLFGTSVFATSLDTNVDELNFGNVQLNTKTNRMLTFVIENDARNNSFRSSRDVVLDDVETEARIQSNCDSVRVSPTRVDIPTGGQATIEVTLQTPSKPGPVLCSVTIDSTELFSGSSGRNTRNSCGSITSARICVEIKANITAPTLTITEFDVDRTTRTGTRSNTNKVVTVTQTGTGSNSTLTADFGSLDVFEEAEATITIANRGDATLQVNIRGTGNDNVSFRGAIGNNISIAPNDDRDVLVFIRSIDGGNFSATLTITPTGTTSSAVQRVTIRFTGNSNSVNVVASKTFVTFEAKVPEVASASSNDVESVDGSSQVVIGQQANRTDEESITIRNEGEGDDLSTVEVTMSIDYIRSTGRTTNRNSRDIFKFEGTDSSNDDLVFTLASNQSQQVTIVYTPPSAGIDEGVIEVEVRLIDANNRRSSQVIQSFFINLRGIAVATTQNASAAASPVERLNLSKTLLQQVSSNNFKFEVQGSGIDAIKAEIFSLSGIRVFNSGYIQGNTAHWNTAADTAQIANGIYFYRLSIRGQDGTIQQTRIKKFVLIR